MALASESPVPARLMMVPKMSRKRAVRQLVICSGDGAVCSVAGSCTAGGGGATVGGGTDGATGGGGAGGGGVDSCAAASIVKTRTRIAAKARMQRIIAALLPRVAYGVARIALRALVRLR